jgi:HK97 family phage portal protein
MGALTRLATWLGFSSQRDLSVDNFLMDDPTDWYTGQPAMDFGIRGDAALRLIPVFAAVALVADALAMLETGFFRQVGDIKQRAAKPAWMIRPDHRLSWFDWIHQAAVSLLLRGNAYGFVIRDAFGQIIGVRWIHPHHVVVREFGLVFPIYLIAGEEYSGYDIGGDILHIRAFVIPGSVVGLSPIAMFREQFETLGAAVQYGHDWFENPVPSGILRNDKASLTQAQMDEAKLRFKTSVKRGEPVALDMNWNWQQVSLSPGDAQFLQTIKASATQIATIFRVDPEDVGGESGSSLKYLTVEGNQRKFNQRTLRSWVRRFEEGLMLLYPPDYSIVFDLDGSALPNALDRAKAEKDELLSGSLTLDEARADRDRPPLTDAEVAFWKENYQIKTAASVTTIDAFNQQGD